MRIGKELIVCRIQNRFDAESREQLHLRGAAAGKTKYRGMWVDKYRPKKFSDLLGEDVRSFPPSVLLAYVDLPEMERKEANLGSYSGSIGMS